MKNHNIKAALFDLDGVIVFTDKYHYLAWKALADEQGWDFDEKLNKNRLVGDVDFAAAAEVAGAITPVPGGVGPMTIAMLMRNAASASAYFHKKNK